MTLTNHSFIELSDLLAVSLVCKCESAATINLDKYKNIPDRCPNCHENWYADTSPGHKALNKMLEAIEDVKKIAEGAPCHVLFEVKDKS
jgi:hypothetical protein